MNWRAIIRTFLSDSSITKKIERFESFVFSSNFQKLRWKPEKMRERVQSKN